MPLVTNNSLSKRSSNRAAEWVWPWRRRPVLRLA
jgi:hypothetical protein